MRSAKKKNISVIGLGKLGLCTAACIARAGYKVFGVDVDKAKVREINKGRSPIPETGLKELMRKVAKRITAGHSIENAVRNSDMTFIVVATPSKADNSFSNAQLLPVLKEIARALKKKKSFHSVVITSTVMPYTTERIAGPLLERISGKICGRDFGLAYNPEFIALGSVLKDFMNPDFILIGESDKRTGDALVKIYKDVCRNKPAFARMKPVSAEITKIALNCYVTTKITFANTLARICERAPGSSVSDVTRALGFDSRIGSKYLKGGLGYGGPCFPRDNRAFARFAKNVGMQAVLAKAVDNVNRSMVKRIANVVRRDLNGKKRVSVLGLSYKPNTEIVEASQSLELAAYLADSGMRVKVYDPAAMNNAKQILGNKVQYAKNMKDSVKNTDCCILATPWEEFKRLPGMISKTSRKAKVFDIWGLNDYKRQGGLVR
ncbi:UDP-glucose dehydrogenase family protein [Elusimicrobiota bacterium]